MKPPDSFGEASRGWLAVSGGFIGRWTAFNVVGLAGMAVQLGLVALLVRVMGWHYLPATAFGVEAAVLHNFAWHQRWTWRDRPSSSGRSTAIRLARFHLLNGAVSLGGNVGLTALCTGLLHVDAIVSNMIAIAVCSLVNFAASEGVVFRMYESERSDSEATDGIHHRVNGDSGVPYVSPFASVALWWRFSAFSVFVRSLPIALLILTLLPRPAVAGQAPATVAAWRAYEAGIEARYRAASSASSDRFFVHDRDALAPGWRESVLRDGQSIVKIDVAPVSEGKIHHWIGAIFVPGVTLDTVLERLERSAGHESDSYEDVLASRLLERTERDGHRVRVFMKLRRTSVITVTYNTEHAVEYKRLAATRASARSVATKIAELGDAGTPREREKPPSDDSGFLWRLNAYWRYEAVPGGVIVECESVSLSRPVPLLVRPIANPMVDRIARESLNRTLLSLRTMLSTKS